MKKILLLFSVILSCFTYAQKQDSIKVYQGNYVQRFLLSEVDSIAHDGGQFVSIYHNNQMSAYAVEKIDSISILMQDKEIRLYAIAKDDLGEWDEGYALLNEEDEYSSLYVVGKYDVENERYIVHFNQLGNNEAEDGITFYLDSDKNIQTIFINSLCYSALAKGDGTISYIGINTEGEIVDSFSLKTVMPQANSSRRVMKSIVDGLNTALDTRTIIQVLDHFNKGEYGEVIATVGPDALIGTMNLDPKSKLITTLLIEALNRLYFNTIKNDFYDGCIPTITSVGHDKVTVSIAGIENLRDWCTLEFTQLGTSKKVYLVIAIGNDSSNGYVTYSNSYTKTSQIQINKNSSTVDVPLPSGLKVGTYYVRPLLITDQVLDKGLATVREWYIQYGATEIFKYPNVTISNVKQNDCKYYDWDHDYSVDLTIDGEINGLDGVTAWGIKVYNEKGYVEKEVTTSSNSTSYSFHYQDIVSEEAFDKKTQTAEFIIVPFAKGRGSDDRVYCEATTFFVNACSSKITAIETTKKEAERGHATFTLDVKGVAYASNEILSTISNVGIYIKNGEDSYKYYPASSISGNNFSAEFSLEQSVYTMDNLDYSAFIATKTIEIGSYIIDGNGEYNRSESQEYELVYDVKPTVTFTNVQIGSPEAYPQYGDDGEYLYTSFSTPFQFNFNVEGAFWINYVQSYCYGGEWTDSEGPVQIVDDGLYENPTGMSYDDSSDMNFSIAYHVYLLDGSEIKSTNTVVIGGSPTSPSGHIGGTPSYAPAKASRRATKERIARSNTSFYCPRK